MCWYNKPNVAAREAEQKSNKNESEKNKEKFQLEDINNNADGVSDIEKNNTKDNHVCKEEEFFCWMVQIVLKMHEMWLISKKKYNNKC